MKVSLHRNVDGSLVHLFLPVIYIKWMVPWREMHRKTARVCSQLLVHVPQITCEDTKSLFVVVDCVKTPGRYLLNVET